MAKKKQQTKSVDTNVPKTDENGEIISWDSASEDGKALKTLFDGGLITTETAKIVKKEHPRFRKHATRTLNSALGNERKRLETEVDTQVKRGSSGTCLGWSFLCCFSPAWRSCFDDVADPCISLVRLSPQS